MLELKEKQLRAALTRGVIDEHTRNQIAAGCESFFLWPTINKNVNQINYIYYNQQRFINYTHNITSGLAE